MILLEDIISNFKKYVYGKKGEQVKLIADHGNVLIVENKSGKRFPVEKVKVLR